MKMVLEIAKYPGVPVVAEGVENQTRLEMLRGMECDLVQGFCFSRPVPPEDFEKFIIRELAAA